MIEYNLRKCESCNVQNKVSGTDITLENKRFKWLCDTCFIEIRRLALQNEKRTTAEIPKKMLRFNEGKTVFTFLHFPFIEEMAKVMMFGASKGYPKDNWKLEATEGQIDNSRVRHCIADINGELYDSESKLTHLAHEAINCMID